MPSECPAILSSTAFVLGSNIEFTSYNTVQQTNKSYPKIETNPAPVGSDW